VGNAEDDELRPYAFDRARGVFVYSGREAELIRLYKLHNHPRLARFFGACLASLIDETAADLPIVPVPGRPSRRRQYGWDQVELLAREIVRLTGKRVIRALERREGTSQKSLGLEERRGNLDGRITCVLPHVPNRCVLIDDVLTTGATLSVCASVLKEAGAEEVTAVVLALD
jgi:ComF family protein